MAQKPVLRGEVILEWLLPLLVQVLVAGPLHHPPLLTSQNMTSTTKSSVDQWERRAERKSISVAEDMLLTHNTKATSKSTIGSTHVP